MSNRVLAEARKHVLSQGPFENWALRPREQRVEEENASFSASAHFRDAANKLYALEALASAGNASSRELVDAVLSALMHMSFGLTTLGEEEASGALEASADYLRDMLYGESSDLYGKP